MVSVDKKGDAIIGLFNRKKPDETVNENNQNTKQVFTTAKVAAENIKVNDTFVDIDGTTYVVERVKCAKYYDVTCVYATTTSNRPDGWFTRDSYDVIQSPEKIAATAL